MKKSNFDASVVGSNPCYSIEFSATILSKKMKKGTDIAKEQHAKKNPKHALAFVLREQWVKDNDGKTLNDWNHNVD